MPSEEKRQDRPEEGKSDAVTAPLTAPVPAAFVVEELTDAENLVRFSSFQRWLDGTQPHMVEGRLERSLSASDVLPVGVDIERSVRAPAAIALIARGEGVTVGMEVGLRYTEYRVSATTAEVAERLAAEIRERASTVIEKSRVPVRVWTNNRGGTYDDRLLEAPAWSEISDNYPKRVRKQIERLMTMERPNTDVPKLILWSGEPGTGKTTAARALASEWNEWCQVQYITDAEHLLNESAYLSGVLDQPAREPQGPTLTAPSYPDETWRLIVVEDADEFVRSSARDRASAALGRLLNLSDGIFGQHSHVLLLLTTNEEINRLHPALIRPGRCLANIEFVRFSTIEAKRWLDGTSDGITAPMTLAELLSKRGDLPPGSSSTDTSPPIGAYL